MALMPDCCMVLSGMASPKVRLCFSANSASCDRPHVWHDGRSAISALGRRCYAAAGQRRDAPVGHGISDMRSLARVGLDDYFPPERGYHGNDEAPSRPGGEHHGGGADLPESQRMAGLRALSISVAHALTRTTLPGDEFKQEIRTTAERRQDLCRECHGVCVRRQGPEGLGRDVMLTGPREIVGSLSRGWWSFRASTRVWSSFTHSQTASCDLRYRNAGCTTTEGIRRGGSPRGDRGQRLQFDQSR